MGFSKNRQTPPVCPNKDKIIRKDGKQHWLRWLLPLSGLVWLIWFLVRVVPKPSRASYPCQRIAFPLASGFVAWFLGLAGSLIAAGKARGYFARSRYMTAAVCLALSVGSIWLAMSVTAEKKGVARQPHPVNAPIGTAKGVNPGRVVWVHDPCATNWGEPNDGNWWESNHTDQYTVDRMMGRAIRQLIGEVRTPDAWDGIFRYFNSTHGKGDTGYQAGEKIVIKVNLVGTIAIYGKVINTPADYSMGDDNYPNTSPQMMLALVRQLVDIVGVNEEDITIGDPLSYFPNEFQAMLYAEFPNIRFLDYVGKFGRTKAEVSDVRMYWSTPDVDPIEDANDYAPASYVEADYLINMANLKGHYDQAGVTLCGKNHYGSLVRNPQDDLHYYSLHYDLINPAYGTPGEYHYRTLVDLMGHWQIGGKTLLYLIDGLYGGQHQKDDPCNPGGKIRWPVKWQTEPFNDDWPSSILVSQDGVAIDSVGFDFLYNEWPEVPGPAWDGGDDYLHEAAEANDPVSGSFYDPNHDGDVEHLESLGVHEHWNDPNEKQYSRNLDPAGDTGIELVAIFNTAPGDFDRSWVVDLNDFALMAANWGEFDTRDLIILAENWLSVINQLPSAAVGSDQEIDLPDNEVLLAGTVTDDGFPDPPAAVTTLWEQVEGPNTAVIDDANSLSTTVTFSQAGIYLFRLTADDGEYSVSDEVIVTVHPPVDSTLVFENSEFHNSWANIGDFKMAPAPRRYAQAICAEGYGWGTVGATGNTNIGSNSYLEFEVYFDSHSSPGTAIDGIRMSVNGDNGWDYRWEGSSRCWVDGIETTVADANMMDLFWHHYILDLEDNAAGGTFPSAPDIGVIRLHLCDPNDTSIYLNNVIFASEEPTE